MSKFRRAGSVKRVDGFSSASRSTQSSDGPVTVGSKKSQQSAGLSQMPKEQPDAEGFRRQRTSTSKNGWGADRVDGQFDQPASDLHSEESLPDFSSDDAAGGSPGAGMRSHVRGLGGYGVKGSKGILSFMKWLSPKRAMLIFIALFIVFGGVFGLRAFGSLKNVFGGGGDAKVLGGDVDPEYLSKEGDGRVNIILMGIGGEGHDGADLTDTIMIASINPFDKQGSLISIPRDYYMEYGGYYTRINAIHSIAKEADPTDDQAGPKALQDAVEDSFDLPLHYFVRIDFDALEQMVDSMGGIEVNVEDQLYDPGVANTYGEPLDFEPGVHYMDGRTALFYSRSRVACGAECNGIGGGDILRTQRQKEVMVGMFNKALSTGVLASPTKINNVASAFGDNVKTSLELSEMWDLYNLGKDFDVNQLQTATVGYEDSDGEAMLDDYTTSEGARVLVPIDGIGDNRRVLNYIHSFMTDSYILREQPRITILNGSSQSGLAQDYADLYESRGYVVETTGNYNQGTLAQTVVIEQNSKPYARNYLLKRFGLQDTSSLNASPEYVTSDYVIILGTDATANAE